MSDDKASRSSTVAALNEIKGMAGEDGTAKLAGSARSKGKVKAQKWGSDERPESLIADISSLIGGEAEEEQQRVTAELRAKEEERRRLEEEQDRQRKFEAQSRLQEEEQRQKELEKRRTVMAAAIEREDKIASGEINPEAEARAKAEAEQEALRQQQHLSHKDEALTEAQRLIQEQKAALDRLSRFEMPSVQLDAEIPKRSSLPLILFLVLILGGGAAAGVYFLTPKPAPQSQAPLEGVTLKGGEDIELAFVAQKSYPTDDGFDTSEHHTSIWPIKGIAPESGSTAEVAAVAPKSRREEGKKRDRKHRKPKATKPATGFNLGDTGKGSRAF